MFTGIYSGIFPSSKTRVLCIYCGVHIPKSPKSIKEHANGARHTENVELASENGIIITPRNVLYCKPCSVDLLIEDSVVSHTLWPGHTYAITAMEDTIDGEYINLRPFLSDTNRDNAFCQVCHVPVYCTVNNLLDHINSHDHKSRVLERVKPLHAIFPLEDGSQAWCKICNVNVDNSVNALLKHLFEKYLQHLCWYITTKLAAREDIIVQGYLANKLDMNAYCCRCRKTIICTSKHIHDHVVTDGHRQLFN